MKNIDDILCEVTLDYNPTDYKKFHKVYDKFIDSVEKDELSDGVKKAIDNIKTWMKDIDKHKGLPMAYWRYDQFVNAIFTFNPSARDGLGDVYDKDITDTLNKLWKKFV